MLETFENFHFIRPYWFTLIPIVCGLHMLAKHASTDRGWQKIIPPKLLNAMVIQPRPAKGLSPTYLAIITLLASLLALAGPTWTRLPTPFGDDQTPLIIVLKMGKSMANSDMAPSRFALAKLKIQDLLKLREGTPTALIVFSDSVHIVLPLTEDHAVLTLYLNALQTDLLPHTSEGISENDISQQVYRLMGERRKVNVLLIGDNIYEANFLIKPMNSDLIRSFYLHLAPSHIEDSFNVYTQWTNGFIRYRADNRDIQLLLAKLDQKIKDSDYESDSKNWKDMGYPMVFVIALILLFWFRPGMVLK